MNTNTDGVSAMSAELGAKKPRLSREWSLTRRRLMWVCRGSGARGMADKPRDAYFDWLWRKDFLSNHIKPSTGVEPPSGSAMTQSSASTLETQTLLM